MAQLRYSPHLAAKNLAASRSGIIDVFIPESIDLSNPFVMHLIAGVSKVLSEHYYSFLILRNRKKEHLCDGYIVTGLLKNLRNTPKSAAVRLSFSATRLCRILIASTLIISPEGSPEPSI